MSRSFTVRLWPVLILLFALPVAAAEYQTIDYDALCALIDRDAPIVLIDTRAEQSYGYGHLPTAISLPGYLFDRPDSIAGLPEDRDTPIVTYCKGGHCGIGVFVAERLLDRGYQKVMVYEGGTDDWLRRGNALVTAKLEKLPTISHADLAALLATGANVRLLDARSAAEFQAQSLPEARHLPVDKVKPGGEDLPPSKSDLAVVFGNGPSDGRPYQAAHRLGVYGYKKVRIYRAGASGFAQKKPTEGSVTP